MPKYISKGDWFEKGTEAILIADYRSKGFENFPISLFEGWRICENPLAEGHKLRERYRDQEDCPFDEFEIIED